jgi:4-hydroxy-tetrahydrodipicolinate synthase
MKDGFYPALGTPTGNNGELIENSYNKEIELMIDAGAQRVLCMGSMGKMAGIKNSEYHKIAQYCFKVVSKRIPVMLGVMDCSVSRVLERIEALVNIDIDGVVATAPYYYKVSGEGIINFFSFL